MSKGYIPYNTYSGIDYTLNHEDDLYFNLFYADMDRALRSGATSLHLGQTSDALKSRLGTVIEDRYYFLRGNSPLITALLRLTTPFISPKVTHAMPHDVFSDNISSIAP